MFSGKQTSVFVSQPFVDYVGVLKYNEKREQLENTVHAEQVIFFVMLPNTTNVPERGFKKICTASDTLSLSLNTQFRSEKNSDLEKNPLTYKDT